MAEVIPPMLLVRLKPVLPTGAVVGERDRVCHLVPVPTPGEPPQVLRAYCGAQITPGSAELLDGVSGMPCEPCMARSPIPAFALLRVLPIGTHDVVSDFAQHGGWSDRALRPEQKVAARFVLLLLLQNPDQAQSVTEIAARLHRNADTVGVILLLLAAVGWVQQSPDPAGQAGAGAYRLTKRGVPRVRRLLAQGLTPTLAILARGLGLDITVVWDRDAKRDESGRFALEPGGCTGSPDGAPTSHHDGEHDATGSPFDDGETSTEC